MSVGGRVPKGTEQGSLEITVLICIQEVPRSHLNRDTGYSD
jgi:hypothetical protein